MSTELAPTPTTTSYGPFEMWHCFCECTPDVSLCGKESPAAETFPEPLGPTCPACEELHMRPCRRCDDTGVAS